MGFTDAGQRGPQRMFSSQSCHPYSAANFPFSCAFQGLILLGEAPPSEPTLGDSSHTLVADVKLEPGIERLVSIEGGATCLLFLPFFPLSADVNITLCCLQTVSLSLGEPSMYSKYKNLE